MKRVWGGRLLFIGMAFGLTVTHSRATALELSKATEIRNFALALTIAGSPQQAKPIAGAQTKPAAGAQAKPPVGGLAKQQENTCLTNAKQIAAAILMYVKANKGVTPKGPDYMEALSSYNKKPEIFQCPLDPKGTVSYTLNSSVAGIAVNSVLLPSNTVLIYEGTGGKLNFRHSGRAVVGFVDGHSSLVDASKATTLVWTVQAPKPVTPINKKPAGK